MLDLNKQMESELSALTQDSEELNNALDNYQSNLQKAMADIPFCIQDKR